MTTIELAGAVAVVKNLMLTGVLSRKRAIDVLWDLANEAGGDSVHYRRGSSAVIEHLLSESLKT